MFLYDRVALAWLTYIVFGATGLVCQVLILREISYLFLGHELSLALGLAAWLFWSGLGSCKPRRSHPALALGAFAALSGWSLLAARACALTLPAGAIPGLWAILVFGTALTAPAGLAVGWFTSSVMAAGTSPAIFYILESLGACLGGLVYTFALAGRVEAMSGAAGFGALAAISGLVLGRGTPRWIILAASLGLVAVAWHIEPASRTWRYPGMDSFTETETPYERLAITRHKTVESVIENGFFSCDYPDPISEETLAHVPLLAHPHPGRILVCGTRGLLILPEALKHRPERMDAPEPDRRKLRVLLKLGLVKPREKTVFYERDARRFLADKQGEYDVIIQSIGEPVNAWANRFFTREFFKIAQKALRPGGILAFSVPSGENYISPEESYLDACILQTAQSVFPHVALVPGKSLMFLAGDHALNLSPELFAKRYAARHLHTQALIPQTFAFLLDAPRRNWAQAALFQKGVVPLNTDFHPVSYFYTWRVWLSKFVAPSFIGGLALCAIILAWALAKLWRLRHSWLARPRLAVMFTAGMWAMSVEISLLLAFQALSGALYWQMGLLFAAFMLGLALGGLALRNKKSLGILLLTAALYSFALALGLERLAVLPEAPLTAVFAALTWATGFLLGAVFCMTASPAPKEGGALYAADVWGGCLGGFLTSAVLVPLAGLKFALIFASVLISLSAIFPGSWRRRTDSGPPGSEGLTK